MPDFKLHINHIFIHHSLSIAIVTNLRKLQGLKLCVLFHLADSWLDGLQGSGQMD